MGDCFPINFNYPQDFTYLAIEGQSNLKLRPNYPNDAGIIQKTYFKKTKIPIFILAGLGIMGTEVSGNVLNKHSVEIGKLYGSNPFCLLFSTDLTKGKEYYEIKGIYPKISIYRKILYPITFYKWHKKNVFPTS